MEDIKSKAESLTDHVSDYVETYVKLAVLNATQKATGVASMSLTAILLTFFIMFVFFFCGVGASIWLGEAMADMKAGYFIVAGFYLLCAFVIMLLRKKIIFPFVSNQIIKKVYEDNSNV